MQKPNINREYKDKLFHFIFANPERKENILSLYNALNNSNYTDHENIEINTVEGAVYVRYRNDLSFIFHNTLSLIEAQSTYNPNMALRFLHYYTELQSKYLQSSSQDPLSTEVITLPTPNFIELYSGKEKREEREIVRLSDHYATKQKSYALDLAVEVYNINNGMNKDLLEKCAPLKEYSWTVSKFRDLKHEHREWENEEVFDQLIRQMPKEYSIRKDLLENRAEVIGMLEELFTEEEQEMIRKRNMEKKLAEATEKGIEIGTANTRREDILRSFALLKMTVSDMTEEEQIHAVSHQYPEYTEDELTAIYQGNLDKEGKKE